MRGADMGSLLHWLLSDNREEHRLAADAAVYLIAGVELTLSVPGGKALRHGEPFCLYNGKPLGLGLCHKSLISLAILVAELFFIFAQHVGEVLLLI